MPARAWVRMNSITNGRGSFLLNCRRCEDHVTMCAFSSRHKCVWHQVISSSVSLVFSQSSSCCQYLYEFGMYFVNRLLWVQEEADSLTTIKGSFFNNLVFIFFIFLGHLPEHHMTKISFSLQHYCRRTVWGLTATQVFSSAQALLVLVPSLVVESDSCAATVKLVGKACFFDKVSNRRSIHSRRYWGKSGGLHTPRWRLISEQWAGQSGLLHSASHWWELVSCQGLSCLETNIHIWVIQFGHVA